MALLGGRLSLPLFSNSDPDLYGLSVVSLLLVSGALIAEPIDVSPAVVELVLGAGAGIAGIPRTGVVDLLGLIGSVYIMYMAGLEVDPRLLRRHLATSLAVGLVSFLAPMSVGFLVLRFLGYGFEEALLASIACSTTSVAVVYAITRRRGLARRPLGQVVLSASMVADIASILAFVAVASGLSLIVAGYLIGSVVLVWGVARFAEFASGGEHEVEMRLVLAVLVSASLVSEYVGVHAILFAFLLGMATRDIVRGTPGLGEKLSSITFGLLAPIFFVDAGLHAAPEHLVEYAELTILLIAMSLPVKVAATHYALLIATGRRIRARLSTVFGARLTVSTVVAFAGEASGVLGHDLAGAIIFSALVATIVSASIAGGGIEVEEV